MSKWKNNQLPLISTDEKVAIESPTTSFPQSTSIHIEVMGNVVAGNDKRLVKAGGFAKLIDKPKAADYKAGITAEARLASRNLTELLGDRNKRKIPLAIIIQVYVLPPISKRKTDIIPCSKPDLDNIQKLVLDALQGTVITNDSRISTILCFKRFDSKPRLVIDVFEWNEINASFLVKGLEFLLQMDNL
jgi:Holliday junction resolvase RusA-like endonuclease